MNLGNNHTLFEIKLEVARMHHILAFRLEGGAKLCAAGKASIP